MTRYTTPSGAEVPTRKMWYFWRSYYRAARRQNLRKAHKFAFHMLCHIVEGRRVSC